MAIIDKGLDGRVALVTGGSRGIGRAICQALGQRGAKVIVNYTSNEEAAREAAQLVEQAGGQATVSCFDVSNSDAVTENVKQLAKDHGGLDILVNNAGIARNGLLMRFKDEDFQRSIEVNVAGAFHCARAAARSILRAKEAGRIINVSSVVGETGNPGQSVYAASKAALIGMTKSLAREFASRGVCVNAVAPGYIETDMTAEHMPDEQRQKLLETIPLGAIGNAAQVADVVAFLAGPEASYITGEVIRVNGGMLM